MALGLADTQISRAPIRNRPTHPGAVATVFDALPDCPARPQVLGGRHSPTSAPPTASQSGLHLRRVPSTYTDASSTLGFGAVPLRPQGCAQELRWLVVPRGSRSMTHHPQGARRCTQWHCHVSGRPSRSHRAALGRQPSRCPHHPQQDLLLAAGSHERVARFPAASRVAPHHLAAQVHQQRADPCRRVFAPHKPRWRLQPSVQSMLLGKVNSLVDDPATLDAFACHQSCVCLRYASRLSDPAALASDGLTLDWRTEVVWLNPPWS